MPETVEPEPPTTEAREATEDDNGEDDEEPDVTTE